MVLRPWTDKAMEHLQYNFEALEPHYRAYYCHLYDRIAALCEEACRQRGSLRDGVKILDVGCGRGELLSRLSEKGFAGLFGADMDERCVELSGRFGTVRQGTVQELPRLFADTQFDLVIACHVLEHVENPREAMQALASSSRGDLILAVPNLAHPFGKLRRGVHYVNEGHQCGWDAPHFRTFIERSCGLKIKKWVFDQALLPKSSRKYLLSARVAGVIEERLLPALAPLIFAHSLICWAER
jgi:2-polyprenyl-3-methyl-5-hydroxy-6-metoxy-1,4-benzoquinol methylase